MTSSKPIRSYGSLAVLALLAGVATFPGADCFVPQKLAIARGTFFYSQLAIFLFHWLSLHRTSVLTFFEFPPMF